jgi:hypothetical protein
MLLEAEDERFRREVKMPRVICRRRAEQESADILGELRVGREAAIQLQESKDHTRPPEEQPNHSDRDRGRTRKPTKLFAVNREVNAA